MKLKGDFADILSCAAPTVPGLGFPCAGRLLGFLNIPQYLSTIDPASHGIALHIAASFVPLFPVTPLNVYQYIVDLGGTIHAIDIQISSKKIYHDTE